ncbi:MAG: hypothetical protein K2Q03_05785 [Sphingobacteriaceae bacterium]|nr:hypothetical protein [Sphingobacteriaceae bacterium]
MNIKNILIGISLSSLSITISSCSLNEEIDKIKAIEKTEITTAINSTILNDTLALKNLLSKSDVNLKENTDKSITFSYNTDSNIPIDKIDFPEIPMALPIAFSLNNFDLNDNYKKASVGDYVPVDKLSNDFDLNNPNIGSVTLPNNSKIKSILLKTGAKISIDLSNNGFTVNKPIQVIVTLPTTIKNNVAYTKTFTIPNFTNQTLSITDLDGYNMSTATIANGSPTIPVDITVAVQKSAGQVSGAISATPKINIRSNYDSVEGFFGKVTLDTPPVETPIEIPMKNLTGSLAFKKLKFFIVLDPIGLEIPFSLNLAGSSISFNGGTTPNVNITGKKYFTGTKKDSIEIDVENINILQLNKIILKPEVIFNESNTGTVTNIFKSNANIKFTTRVEAPLDITTSGLSFVQEGDNAFSDSNTKDIDISNAEIKLKGFIKSTLPLGAEVQVHYSNVSNGAKLDKLFDTPIAIENGVEKPLNIMVSMDKFNALKKFKYQIVEVKLKDGGAFKTDQNIIMKLNIATKATATF